MAAAPKQPRTGPKRLVPALVPAALGVLLGVGVVTADYAEATSYLSDDPAACANCHIMQAPFDSWQTGSHHTIATCVDCHLPHAGLAKWVAKSTNGWNHSAAFTLQDFPEPIRITPPNAAILHDNCVRCHAGLVHAQAATFAEQAPRCTRCHAGVGHGETLGLGGPMPPDPLDELPASRANPVPPEAP